MELNACKTKTMIVSRSRTVHPQLTALTLDGTVLKESGDLFHIGGYIGSTLKSAVFSFSSSLPPPVGGGGGLVCESVGKADLLSDHFDGKQSRESVDLPLTCHPSPSLTSIAFRSSEVRRLLLYLDPYGGSDPFGMFPLFLKRTYMVTIKWQKKLKKM